MSLNVGSTESVNLATRELIANQNDAKIYHFVARLATNKVSKVTNLINLTNVATRLKIPNQNESIIHTVLTFP